MFTLLQKNLGTSFNEIILNFYDVYDYIFFQEKRVTLGNFEREHSFNYFMIFH